MISTVEQGLAHYRKALLVYSRNFDRLKQKYKNAHSLLWPPRDIMYVEMMNERFDGMAMVLGLSEAENEAIKRELKHRLVND